MNNNPTSAQGYSAMPPSQNIACVTPECYQAQARMQYPNSSNIGALINYSQQQPSVPMPLPTAAGMSAAGNGQTPDLTPITNMNQPAAMSLESRQYLNGFLRSQIGRKVTIDFLVGTNTITDRTGILLDVGANYVLINEVESDDLVACDFYNIKFVKFYY